MSEAAALSTHLRRLEAEAIGILREVAAEFRNPVLLYSIGKDFERPAASGAKGVPPGEAALPRAPCRYDLEIPRDDRLSRRRSPRKLGIELIVHTNQEGVERGIDPDRLGLGAAYRR